MTACDANDAGDAGDATVCVDLADSTSHCGACGHACAARQSCSAGMCACAAPLTACGALCVDDARMYADRDAHLSWVVYLAEGTNTIDVLYGRLAGATRVVDGGDTTAGLGFDATHGVAYESMTPGSITPGLRVRFAPQR